MEQHQQIVGNETVWTPESGQAVIPLLLVLSLFLLGMFGFAVDLTDVWFHRQAASAAADAACEAGGMDMLSTAAGVTPTGAGFTAGTASNCVSSSSATMCAYAKDNGYTGAGLIANSPSNSVSWSFPSSVPGVKAGAGTNSFLQVVISENVPAYFMRLLTRKPVINISVTTTCGVASVKSPAPMVILNTKTTLPSGFNGTFDFEGGGQLWIVGGPQRSVQINSANSNAVYWHASAYINTSSGGPNQTGSDVAVAGSTVVPDPTAFVGGTTGTWKSNVMPIPDPYGSVSPPNSVKTLTPSTGTSGKSVNSGVDNCPDPNGCLEFGPGYYPSGINLGQKGLGGGNVTAIFIPGIYYMNGSLSAGNSVTLRVAKPSTYKRTDGLMFYFYSGSLSISGCSGCTNTTITSVPSTDLTCDGNPPPAALGMPSTLNGNVLYGQCTNDGTYWDAGGDTSDSAGSPGSRGLLFFQDHANATQPAFTGSGALTFGGALYFHNTNYTDALALSGGSGLGTFILGNIVTDNLSLTGSGIIRLALNPAPSADLAKVGLF